MLPQDLICKKLACSEEGTCETLCISTAAPLLSVHSWHITQENIIPCTAGLYRKMEAQMHQDSAKQNLMQICEATDSSGQNILIQSPLRKLHYRYLAVLLLRPSKCHPVEVG